MKKGERTRERMVEATGHLLQTQGYFGTSVKDILAASEAPRGSFYFHFPGGKEELACAALQASGQRWRETVLAAAATSDEPGAAIRAVCDALATSLVESDYHRGCPLATAALEAAASSDAIQEVCASHFSGWHALLEARLSQLGVSEAMRPALATLILSAVEGAQLLARAHRSPEPLRQVGDVLAVIAKTVTR
jgi:TetR/AcrR family transcriptional repressor of lmrAB and yxaGH operons